MSNPHIVHTSDSTFSQDVLKSDKPVLLDFWAEWCGPCKAIGPILEKLEVAYGGAFKLAKINSDEEQQLAGAFGIRSIPTVVLMKNGQPVDGFMGALPEGKIKEFLDKHVPAAGELEAEAAEEEALDALADGDPEVALEKLQHAVATDPATTRPLPDRFSPSPTSAAPQPSPAPVPTTDSGSPRPTAAVLVAGLSVEPRSGATKTTQQRVQGESGGQRHSFSMTRESWTRLGR